MNEFCFNPKCRLHQYEVVPELKTLRLFSPNFRDVVETHERFLYESRMYPYNKTWFCETCYEVIRFLNFDLMLIDLKEYGRWKMEKDMRQGAYKHEDYIERG